MTELLPIAVIATKSNFLSYTLGKHRGNLVGDRKWEDKNTTYIRVSRPEDAISYYFRDFVRVGRIENEQAILAFVKTRIR